MSDRTTVDGFRSGVSSPRPRPRLDNLNEHSAVMLYEGMRGSYSRIAFVSSQRHLGQLARSGDLLVVACDWLAWWDAIQEGFDALHLEAGLMDSAEADARRDDLLVRANAWAYDGDRDLSIYRDVSLARMFTRETSLFLLSWHQLSVAAGWFLRKFRPAEVILFDIRNEFDLVPETMRRNLMLEIAAAAGTPLDDRWDPGTNADGTYPLTRPYRVDIPSSTWLMRPRSIGRALFTALIDWITSLRPGEGGGIFLLHTSRSTRNLLRAYDAKMGLHPMLMADRESKALSFIALCLAKGIRLVKRPSDRLTAGDLHRLGELTQTLRAHLMADHTGDSAARMADYVRNAIVDTGRLEKAARAVNAAARLLDRYRPKQVVVSDYMNPGTHEFIELAFARRIPVNYAPHGMRLSGAVQEMIVGSKNVAPKIDRVLMTGPQNLAYLEDHGRSRVGLMAGYPALDNVNPPPIRASAPSQALILPYSFDSQGWLSQTSFIYGALAATVRILGKSGYGAIVVKVHPGSIFNPAYYKRVLEKCGLVADVIHNNEPMPSSLENTSIVVGPAVSGAFMEAMAAGKPYFALHLPPSSNPLRYLDGLDVVVGTEGLNAALARRWRPDTSKVLDHLCSYTPFHPSAPRFWSILSSPYLG